MNASLVLTAFGVALIIALAAGAAFSDPLTNTHLLEIAPGLALSAFSGAPAALVAAMLGAVFAPRLSVLAAGWMLALAAALCGAAAWAQLTFFQSHNPTLVLALAFAWVVAPSVLARLAAQFALSGRMAKAVADTSRTMTGPVFGSLVLILAAFIAPWALYWSEFGVAFGGGEPIELAVNAAKFILAALVAGAVIPASFVALAPGERFIEAENRRYRRLATGTYSAYGFFTPRGVYVLLGLAVVASTVALVELGVAAGEPRLERAILWSACFIVGRLVMGEHALSGAFVAALAVGDIVAGGFVHIAGLAADVDAGQLSRALALSPAALTAFPLLIIGADWRRIRYGCRTTREALARTLEGATPPAGLALSCGAICCFATSLSLWPGAYALGLRFALQLGVSAPVMFALIFVLERNWEQRFKPKTPPTAS